MIKKRTVELNIPFSLESRRNGYYMYSGIGINRKGDADTKDFAYLSHNKNEFHPPCAIERKQTLNRVLSFFSLKIIAVYSERQISRL